MASTIRPYRWLLVSGLCAAFWTLVGLAPGGGWGMLIFMSVFPPFLPFLSVVGPIIMLRDELAAQRRPAVKHAYQVPATSDPDTQWQVDYQTALRELE